LVEQKAYYWVGKSVGRSVTKTVVVLVATLAVKSVAMMVVAKVGR
jgi:hypothetical protein